LKTETAFFAKLCVLFATFAVFLWLLRFNRTGVGRPRVEVYRPQADNAETSDIPNISQKWDSNIPKAKRFAANDGPTLIRPHLRLSIHKRG
jgi:hypothetical protein